MSAGGVSNQPQAAFVERPEGTRIAYDVSGTGPPIVLLHGLTGDRQRWRPVSDLLRDDHTCIRIDLRGHGQSSKSSDYSLLAMAQDVTAVIDELGVASPAVVGNSMGGSTAAIFAVLHEARAVVVIDQVLRPSAFASRVRHLEDRLRGTGFAEAMVEFEESLDLGPLSSAARAKLYASVREADPEVVLGVWAPLFVTTDEDLDHAMAAALSHLRSRCLCLYGSQPPDGYAAWLDAVAPNVDVEVWPGLGHLLHLVEPVRTVERVRRYLDSAARSGSALDEKQRSLSRAVT